MLDLEDFDIHEDDEDYIESQKRKQQEEELMQATSTYQATESQNEGSEKKSNIRWGLIVVMILVSVLLGLFLAFYGEKIIWAILSLFFVFSVIFRYFRS